MRERYPRGSVIPVVVRGVPGGVDLPPHYPISAILAVVCWLVSLAQVSQSAETVDAAALFNSGKYVDCIRACAEGLEQRSWRESLWRLKIQAQMETGQYKEALATYEAAVERFSSSIRLRMAGVEVCRLNDQTDRADLMLPEIQALINRQSWRRDAITQVLRGRFLLMRGADARQVLEVFYNRAKEQGPGLVEPYIAISDLGLEKHDHALAVDALEKAVKIAPEDPSIHLRLANAFAESNPERAASALTRALELNPNHVDSLMMQVDKMIDAEQYDAAAAVLDRVEKVNPKHPAACAYRAVLAHLLGDEPEEKKWRQAALKPWSTNPEVDYLIGRKLSQKYRFTEGAEHQRQAITFDSNYLPAKFQLSQDLLRLGENVEGWRLANEVYEQDSYNVAAHNLVVLQDSVKGFAKIESDGFVLHMDPREAEIYGHRALALLERARRVLCDKYQVQFDGPIVVEIFPDKQDFAVRTFGIPFVEGFLGVCFGSVITANSPASGRDHPSNWEAVLWHEFCHAVTLHKSKNRMPRWLSEGISVYEERQENAAWGQSMNLVYRQRILDGGLTPVSELSSAFLQPKSPMDLSFAYFESSLVVEYLMETHGIEAVRNVLADLGRGTSTTAALERHVDSLDKLDANFAAFARKRAEQFAAEADFTPPQLPPNAAIEDLQQWCEQNPKNLPGLHVLANGLAKADRWPEAKKVLTQLIDLCPGSIDGDNPYVLLAHAHQQLGEATEERKVLEQLAVLDSDATSAYRRLTELCLEAEDWEGLAVNAERMLAVDPLVREPYRLLAQASAALKDHGRAIVAYRALLQMDPLDPVDTHYRLARLLVEQGDMPAARRHVLMALEDAPRYRDAQRLLLEIVDRAGNDASNDTPAASTEEVAP